MALVSKRAVPCLSRLIFCRRGQGTIRGVASVDITDGKIHFRQNAWTGDYVVYSPSRSERPKQTIVSSARQKCADFPPFIESCPFCRGNEDKTPPATLEYLDDKGDWLLRVFPNKYPAIRPLSDDEIPTSALAHQAKMEKRLRSDDPTSNFLAAFGCHEVVVESVAHNTQMATSPIEMTLRLVRAFRERGRVLQSDPRVRHIHFFKNSGGAAGASLVHPHSQIVALPIVSNSSRQRLEYVREYYARNLVPIMERVVELETEAGVRIVEENSAFLAIVPFAALCPFEILIVPKHGGTYFQDISDTDLYLFAEALHRVLRRLYIVLDEPDYNMVIRQAPRWSRKAYDFSKFCTWHCCIFPRLGPGGMAGFEFGTGIFSNANLPEADAAQLREVEL